MSLPTVSPIEAKQMIDQGAILIDVREPDEHARERIAGARLMPLSKLGDAAPALPGGRPILFHCKSGARTQANAQPLAEATAGTCDAYIVSGGLDAWRRAGLPVVQDRRQPLELQRQVQIGAGSLALAGTILGLTVSPWFLAVPAFVGAGLLTAGLTGFCGLARLLMRAPWNRATYGAAG